MQDVRQIPGYSAYGATEDGRIFKLSPLREVAQVYTGIPAYLYVNLYTDEGRRVLRRVHQLVALAHIPNPENLPCVDHKDRNSFNNKADNLRWVSHTSNMQNTKANIVPGGLKKFVRDAVPDYTESQYHALWRLQKSGVCLEYAWERVFPAIPFPAPKEKPSL